MAVLTRPCSVFHCANSDTQHSRSLQNGRPFKSACNFVRTQLCTIALSLTLFNSNRLPREAFQYGSVPYLVIYSFWLLVVGLPTTLLQLSVAQLSQQDVAGVWRAVPILRGVGHLKYLTSYICCVYNMLNIALVAAYIIWIGKGTFPLKDCTKLRMTPRGYENKMNASECFNSTFLSPFPETPQYLGIMAILIFVLWFFLPIFLYRLRKTLTVALSILVPITIICAIVLSTFLSRNEHLASLFESCEQWSSLYQPYIWFSAMIQALMSTHIVGGYLITAGSTVYKHSDVRLTSSTVITTNLIAGWLWVLLWESIGGNMKKDQSFVTIPVLIYQSSVVERRTKQWPILAFGTLFLSGVITVITLLYPVYDKIHRLTGDSWRLFASASSAVGTALTVVLLAKGLDIVSLLDSIALPILSVFTTTIEIVGFVLIYGWYYLAVDIEFLTGSRLPCTWIATWWMAPVFLIGVTGWWLRALLRATVSQPVVQFSLLGIMVLILATMLVFAAIAVAKEEQYNLLSKIASAFKPSRLWGPEEPMARYVWMSQRYAHALSTGDTNSEIHHYSDIIPNKEQEKYEDDYLKRRTYTIHTKTGSDDEVTYKTDLEYSNYSLPHKNKKKLGEEKFRSPNICVAKTDLGDNITCNCNRHFKLDIPNLKSCEVTTIL